MPLLPLLALLCWSSAAFASDSPAGAERSLATEADLARAVQDVRAAANGPVLLAAAGPEAERAALAAAATLPAGSVRVQRVGYIGDSADEVGRALTASGLACAVRIGATPAGGWTFTPYGACTGAAVPTPGAATAPPAGGSVASIPGAGAAIGGFAPATAPGAVTAEVAPRPLLPPPPPSEDALKSTYDAVALLRVPNPKPRADVPEATWAVRDGRGRPLDAAEFAKRTGDVATERRIGREAKVARGLGIGLAATGGALVLSGLGVLAARDAGAPEWSTFEPDLSDFDTNAAYFDALAQAEADYEAAQDVHDIRRDDRVWIAGFLTGAGAIALGAAPFASRGAADRATLPALYWDEAAADALIVAHNASVKQRIGLAEPAPAKAVIITPPPEPDETLDEDPPEDAPEEEPEAAPPAPADPSGPSGSRGLQFTPVLGLAWAGIAGTF